MKSNCPQPISKNLSRKESAIKGAMPRKSSNSIVRPTRPKGGKSGLFLLWLMLLAACGFLYAMIHFGETPQQVWNRIGNQIFLRNLPESSPQTAPSTPAQPRTFVHPGLLHTESDFDRMRAKVRAQQSPWNEGWSMLIQSPLAQLGREPRTLEVVKRGGAGQNFPVLFNDIHAAYQLGLRWKISEDPAYAEAAVRILNAWSAKLQSVEGNADRFLAAGIYGYQFANAGEIMRTWSGWNRADLVRFQEMLLRIFYPMNKDFLERHNGAAITNYWANWDLCNIACMQAIGVLCDRRDIYDEAVDYFLKTGRGNGALDKAVYYIHDGYLGQWQEAGRDQGHTTLGIALAGPILETAWNQGDDLYGYDNNRFLAGAEYVAKFNLGNAVPFRAYLWGTGQRGDRREQTVISGGPGTFRAGYELVYNHYVNRKGIAAPYTAQYAARMCPEGGPGGHASTFDQFGFGTLTATRDPEVTETRPSGLTVQKRGGKAVLSWWGAAGADAYNIKRGSAPGGPYSTVAAGIKDPLTWTDENVTSEGCFYVVTAVKAGQETGPSNEVSFSAAPVLRTHLRSGELHRKEGYVTLPTGIVRELSDFTIAAWVNLEKAPPWSRLFDFGNNRGCWMMLTPNCGNGRPRFEVTTVYGYNAQRIDAVVEFPVQRWVHLAVRLSGSIGTLYLDGVEVGSNPGMDLAPFRLGETTRNWIGRSQFENDPDLPGKVDDFRIYDGALSPAEITELAGAGRR